MYSLNIRDVADFVQHTSLRKKKAVMIWGQPGVGKSKIMEQLAQRNDAILVDIRLSQYDSVDLRGVPTVDGGATVWNVPATMPFKSNPAFNTFKGLIVLFFDEINAASKATEAVAYQIINDRRSGEHELMDNVVIVAAGNREGDKGVTNRMALPLCNRFTHVEAVVSHEAFQEYLIETGRPAECVAFFGFRKNLTSTFDPSRPDKAFATPRTWDHAFDYYTDTETPAHIKRAQMAGAVGEGPSGEFLAFVECINKVIPIKDIIADPLRAPLPDELSMRYATAVSISGSMELKTVKPLHTYLKRMDPEFMILAWQTAVRRDSNLFAAPEFLELATEYRSLFHR